MAVSGRPPREGVESLAEPEDIRDQGAAPAAEATESFQEADKRSLNLVVELGDEFHGTPSGEMV